MQPSWCNFWATAGERELDQAGAEWGWLNMFYILWKFWTRPFFWTKSVPVIPSWYIWGTACKPGFRSKMGILHSSQTLSFDEIVSLYNLYILESLCCSYIQQDHFLVDVASPRRWRFVQRGSPVGMMVVEGMESAILRQKRVSLKMGIPWNNHNI